MDEKFKQEVKAQIDKIKKDIYQAKKEIYNTNSKKNRLSAELQSLNRLLKGTVIKTSKKTKLPTPPVPTQ